jgi:hypothetical protein
MTVVLSPRASAFALCLASILGLSGCAHSYTRVYLDPKIVDDPRGTVSAVCVRSSDSPEPVEKMIVLGPRRHLSRDPTGSVAPPGSDAEKAYLIGPAEPPGSRRTESPFVISGGVIGLTGVAAAGFGGFTTLACMDNAGCDTRIPGGIAIAGVGLAVVGGVLGIIAAVNPKLGTHPIADHIDDRGRGRVCNPRE